MKRITLLLTCLLLVGIAGCYAQKTKIVGKWKDLYPNGNLKEEITTFNANGTYGKDFVYEYTKNYSDGNHSFTYEGHSGYKNFGRWSMDAGGVLTMIENPVSATLYFKLKLIKVWRPSTGEDGPAYLKKEIANKLANSEKEQSAKIRAKKYEKKTNYYEIKELSDSTIQFSGSFGSTTYQKIPAVVKKPIRKK